MMFYFWRRDRNGKYLFPVCPVTGCIVVQYILWGLQRFQFSKSFSLSNLQVCQILTFGIIRIEYRFRPISEEVAYIVTAALVNKSIKLIYNWNGFHYVQNINNYL